MNVYISEFTGLGNSILIRNAVKKLKKKLLNIDFHYFGDNKYKSFELLENDDSFKNFINIKSLGGIYRLLKMPPGYIIVTSSSFIPFKYLFIILLFSKSIFVTDLYNLKKQNFFKRLVLNFLFYLRNKFERKTSILDITNIDIHEILVNYNLIAKTFHIDQIKNVENIDKLNFTQNKQILDKFGLKSQKYICFQPNCSSGNKSPKNWPDKNVLDFLNNYNFSDYKLVLIGEKNENRDFYNNFSGLVNLIGKTSIYDLPNILFYSKLIVAVEGGIVHLSEALEKKVICLWGPSDMRKNQPVRNSTEIIKYNLSCAPCCTSWIPEQKKTEIDFFHDCKINIQCMRSINYLDINNKINNILS